jgi:hypothetical protein
MGCVDLRPDTYYKFYMPSYTSIQSGASFQGRDAELVSMTEEVRKVKAGDRTVAVASYWFNRNWLVKKFFPEEAEGLDEAGLKKLGDEQGLPERCPGSLWALNQVRKERRDIFIDSGLSFSNKTADQIKDLADLDADSVPGAYQVPYYNGPTGSGKTMLVRIYAASFGKAYFPVLCTGDDELMLTKKLKGKKDLRASVRTEEMKKRAEFGVFETGEAQLAFLRALRKNGAGTTLESHQDAFRKISQTDWDFVAEANGFPGDDSFSGIYVYGEAELAARIPMGVVVNFDEYGLATGAVQADIRELFFDRSNDLAPGVNAIFTTTDNPAGEKYFNRTPIAGDNASRLQFRPVPLPSPDELVPDVARSFGYKVEVEEANKRLLGDAFCSTTPGLEEVRPSILKDVTGMDKDVIPPAKLVSGKAGQGDATQFFRDILGDEADAYFPENRQEKVLSKFLTPEQGVNLSMRLVSLFCRVYKHVNDPTGPLNPKFYNHDSANSPEFSRRTLRSICAGIENRMRDFLEELKDGAKVNVPEQLALCVQKTTESYIFKQLDFRTAPSGTTIDGDSTRKAARESRPVISQNLRDSGLGWGDLKELFAPAQGGWIEDDLQKILPLKENSKTAQDLAGAGMRMVNEMKPQDSLIRLRMGNESFYFTAGKDFAEGGGLEAKALYKFLDPVSEGLPEDKLQAMFSDYKRGMVNSDGFSENTIFDAAIKITEQGFGDGGHAELSGRISGATPEVVDFGAKWGSDISKSTGGSGIYVLSLGQGKAIVFDHDPSAGEAGKTVAMSVGSQEELVSFLSKAVTRGDAPGFSLDGTGRVHRTINFLNPSSKALYVKKDGDSVEFGREVPKGMPITHTPQVKDTEQALTKSGGFDEQSLSVAKISKIKKTVAPRKKHIYHKRDQTI